jgi:hypothetical protein
MKFCSRCKKQKSLDEFNKLSKAKDGRQSYCRECSKHLGKTGYKDTCRRREAIAARRDKATDINRAWIAAYLSTHHCVDCGNDDPEVLEFDHIPGWGEKIGNLSNMINQGFALRTVQAEVAKCQVRCANCHRKITFRRFREAA